MKKYTCLVDCKICKKRLRFTKPMTENELKTHWGEFYGWHKVKAAEAQRAMNCYCFDSESGKGAPVETWVWDRIDESFLKVKMKNVTLRDFTIVGFERYKEKINGFENH